MLPIVVLGATGYTGRLVVAELAARQLPCIAAGRDPARLEALARRYATVVERRPADPTRPATLTAALAGASVAINCIGPFLRFGEPVVKAAVAQGVHYVDSTGEQPFVQQVYTAYDAPARAKGIALIPALAFEYALADLAAALLLGAHPEVRRLYVLYKASATGLSRGTKKSVLRMLARRGVGYEDGRLAPLAAGAFGREFRVDGRPRTGVWFPGGEPLMIPRHSAVATVRSYMSFPPRTARRISALGPLLPALLRPWLLPLLDRLIDATHREPEQETASQSRIQLEGETDDGRIVRYAVSGGNAYVLTAALLVEGARRLAAGHAAVAGARSPAEAFAAADFLAAVAARCPGLTYGAEATA